MVCIVALTTMSAMAQVTVNRGNYGTQQQKETSFSEKIKAIEFVMLDIDNNGIIGLAKEYVNLAIEQAVEFDKNEVKQ